MARKTPTPVRFDVNVAERLAAYVAAHPGLTLSSTANRLVDEALRTIEHPGVVFREGPAGRRAGLLGGPDIAEIIRAVRSGRVAEPELTNEAVIAMVATNTGMPPRLVRTAVRYWSSYPAEIDAEIAAAEQAEEAAERAWLRERELLRR